MPPIWVLKSFPAGFRLGEKRHLEHFGKELCLFPTHIVQLREGDGAEIGYVAEAGAAEASESRHPFRKKYQSPGRPQKEVATDVQRALRVAVSASLGL